MVRRLERRSSKHDQFTAAIGRCSPSTGQDLFLPEDSTVRLQMVSNISRSRRCSGQADSSSHCPAIVQLPPNDRPQPAAVSISTRIPDRRACCCASWHESFRAIAGMFKSRLIMVGVVSLDSVRVAHSKVPLPQTLESGRRPSPGLFAVGNRAAASDKDDMPPAHDPAVKFSPSKQTSRLRPASAPRPTRRPGPPNHSSARSPTRQPTQVATEQNGHAHQDLRFAHQTAPGGEDTLDPSRRGYVRQAFSAGLPPSNPGWSRQQSQGLQGSVPGPFSEARMASPPTTKPISILPASPR